MIGGRRSEGIGSVASLERIVGTSNGERRGDDIVHDQGGMTSNA
jgi:hypothetical protein